RRGGSARRARRVRLASWIQSASRATRRSPDLGPARAAPDRRLVLQLVRYASFRAPARARLHPAQDRRGAPLLPYGQALAPRTEVRRAGADDDAPDRPTAARARLAGSLV